MQQIQEEKFKFGLIGKNISYSFSRSYFTNKFEELKLNNYKYVNFDIDSVDKFKDILKNNSELKGLNVTIPYKEEIIYYLDELDETARNIKAVNTIKILSNGTLKGFNTDVYGFENSLKPYLRKYHDKALILGTGGASKAIKFVLDGLAVKAKFISRYPRKNNEISYESISDKMLKEYKLIINCTPLGTFPDTDKLPSINYDILTKKHLLFDLIYNPSKTAFLKEGEKRGSCIVNGLKMLELQAEEAWRIWNS